MRSGFCLGVIVLFLGCASPEPARLILPQSYQHTARGMELVQGLAACGYCHGSEAKPDAVLSGGRAHFDRYGSVAAANLTPAESGLAGWDVNDILTALRQSRGKDGRPLSAAMHEGNEWLSDEDALAIAAYLLSLAPIEQTVPRRRVGPLARNTLGFFEGRREVAGYVPALDPASRAEYGQYLVDNVAACSRCHDGPERIFGAPKHLAGGRKIKIGPDESKPAPAIVNSEDGIAAWDEGDIMRYLREGVTKDVRQIDRRFCPVDFYKNALEGDLQAIADYMKAGAE